MAAKITLLVDRLPEDAKMPKQAREIMEYLISNDKITVGEPVDQKDLLANLDYHQDDNKILSTTPKQPISRIFQFYRKSLCDAGYLGYERVTVAKEPKAKKEAADGDQPRRKKKADVSEEAAA